MSLSLFTRLDRRYGPKVDLLSRRDMLKATLAASAGLLISGPTMRALASSRAGKRVVVIGAGFAGLAAAHELTSAGYDVTVVESRDRLGGRVLSFSDFIPGRNIEGGGELIGSNHPAWVCYAHKFGLEFLDVGEDEGTSDPMIIDGKSIEPKEAARVWESMKEALNQMNDLAKDIDADAPWKSPKAKELDAKTIDAWIKELDTDALTKRACWINQTSDNGQSPSRMSLLGQLAAVKGGGLEKFWSDTEVYRCKGGNQQLATKLAGAIGQQKIILGLPVTEVDARSNICKVTCRDGRVIECDDVVLAVPPTVWKKIQFTPGLPKELTPQTGLNTKYLAHVKDRFWQKDKLSQYALSDLAVEQTWDATDGQDGEGAACMVGFSGGSGAEKTLSWSKADREKKFAEILSRFYPGYDKNFVSARFMDWPNEQWTGCSYSFPAPGQVTTIGPMLAAGMGRLHFAGEHCCYKFVGYMEGGLQSGIAAAKKIAKRDGVTIEDCVMPAAADS